MGDILAAVASAATTRATARATGTRTVATSTTLEQLARFQVRILPGKNKSWDTDFLVLNLVFVSFDGRFFGFKIAAAGTTWARNT